jgi:hypothetical protein
MTAPLFEQQATGGAVARGGFEYQDAYLLQHFPTYLAQGAFSHAVSELLGDIEVRYHRTTGGTYCVLYEAKGYQLSEKELWAEVDRFAELYGKAPDEYVRFVLVCADYLNKLTALFNKLDRLRGPGASLNTDSVFRDSAEKDLVDTIMKMGRSREIADFVLARVSFVTYTPANLTGGFSEMLTEHLSSVADMTGRERTAFQSACKQLVDGSTKGVVTRAALEHALVQSAPSVAAVWAATPTAVLLKSEPVQGIEELALDVSDFNGDSRGALGSAAWNDLRRRLEGLGAFIQSSRQRRAVSISAKQRMTLACLLGFAFSATRGFTLQMAHNAGPVHDTANHDRSAQAFFAADDLVTEQSRGPAGVVAICCPNLGRDDVLTATSAGPLDLAPKLFLESAVPVADGLILNTAVAETKAAVVAFRSRHQLSHIHLFVKAPSFFAMALGHRLNGVGEVQLYDWVGNGYAATALIG